MSELNSTKLERVDSTTSLDTSLKQPLKNNNNQTNQSNTQPANSTHLLRLLVDKLVFLDLNNYKSLNKTKECLKLIGAKLADCLSKDVNYVITNRELPSNENVACGSPITSSFSSNSLNENEVKVKKTSPTLSMFSRSINRTQAILQKASKGVSSDIITTARRLGIKIINISELERYIEKYINKKKSIESNNSCNQSISTKTDLIKASQTLRTENQKIYKLKTPFVKFESICKQYKPIYEEFAAWHELNVEFSTVKKICSPFQIYFDDDVSTDCSSSSQVERNESNATTKTASNRPLFKSPTSSTATRPTNRSTVLNKTNTTTNPAVKKPTGYCESCKQRFDNLKQHLTSLQHENFERNLSNFKEIDELINGFLSFNSFLVKKGLLKEVPVDMPATPSPIEPVTDINELKLFAKTFSNRRMKLGIGQTQIVNELKAETNNLINETTLSRFEKLDITPRSGAKMKPVLDRWINETELKFADRMKAVTAERSQINMETQSNQAETPSKKRKRLDSFSPRTIETLNESYRSNQNPSDGTINDLARKLNHDQELIRFWFHEKKTSATPNNNTCSNAKNENSNLKQQNIKKFKRGANIACSVAITLLNETSSAMEDETSHSLSSSVVQSPQANFNSLKSKFTPNRVTPSRLSIIQNSNSKKTPSLVSSLSLSSPSAALLFNLNSNNSFKEESFQMSTSNANFKLLHEKVEFMNSNSELVLKKTSNEQNGNLSIGLNESGPRKSFGLKEENSTDLSCIDDVVLAAFINDFSYEVVQK